jgi:hypothetical protein
MQKVVVRIHPPQPKQTTQFSQVPLPALGANPSHLSEPTHEQKDNQDDQDYPNSPAGVISPLPAVRPRRQSPQESQHQDNQQNCQHIPPYRSASVRGDRYMGPEWGKDSDAAIRRVPYRGRREPVWLDPIPQRLRVLDSQPGWRCILRRSGVHCRSTAKLKRKFRFKFARNCDRPKCLAQPATQSGYAMGLRNSTTPPG